MDGLRIGVTAGRRGGQLASALKRHGATVVHGPTVGGDDAVPASEIVADLDIVIALRPTWFVASTGVGMRVLADAAREHGRYDALREVLAGARCVARGSKAVGGLAAFGVEAVFVSPQETDADVASWLADRVLRGDTVAVQLHGAPNDVYGRLRAAGGDVVTLAPYRAVLPADTGPAVALVRAILAGDIDVLTCTSARAARNLLTIADEIDLRPALIEALSDRVAVAVVGPVTATALEAAGVPVAIMPVRARSGDLVRTLDAWSRRDATSRPAPRTLRLVPERQAVVVGDREIELGERGYAVLTTLVRRPGVACRLETIIAEAWGHDAPDDTSAVKHQVARLRRKLGAAARIDTVRGVGYRYAPVPASHEPPAAVNGN